MRIVMTLAVLALIPLVAGCTVSGAEYYYGVQGMKSGTETTTWENPKDQAVVQMGVQGSGSVQITIKDADGKTVYDKAVTATGQSGSSETTAIGKSGTWTITLKFNSLSGQGGIRVAPKQG